MSHIGTEPTPQHDAEHRTRLSSPGTRVLLALDGCKLSQDVVAVAAVCCRRLADRVDVLVVRPSRTPTSLVGKMLLELERSGMDYRLTSIEGELGAETESYLARFPGIGIVLLDRLGNVDGDMGLRLAELGRQGYRVLTFADALPKEAVPQPLPTEQDRPGQDLGLQVARKDPSQRAEPERVRAVVEDPECALAQQGRAGTHDLL